MELGTCASVVEFGAGGTLVESVNVPPPVLDNQLDISSIRQSNYFPAPMPAHLIRVICAIVFITQDLI